MSNDHASYEAGMPSRFMDDRSGGVAPSSINRSWPPATSDDSGYQRADASLMASVRPGPVQKKRGKLPEEGKAPLHLSPVEAISVLTRVLSKAISVMKTWLFANTHQ